MFPQDPLPLTCPVPAPVLHKPAAWPACFRVGQIFLTGHHGTVGLRARPTLGIFRSHSFMVAQTGKELAPGGTQQHVSGKAGPQTQASPSNNTRKQGPLESSNNNALAGTPNQQALTRPGTLQERDCEGASLHSRHARLLPPAGSLP